MQHTFIIAEIGINHQGSVELFKKMIVEAQRAGADAVKGQKR
jgi:sialic acid synthase SpsE